MSRCSRIKTPPELAALAPPPGGQSVTYARPHGRPKAARALASSSGPSRLTRHCASVVVVAVLVVAAALGGNVPAAHAAESTFGFGKPASPNEIAGWDIDVRRDGAGLPP